MQKTIQNLIEKSLEIFDIKTFEVSVKNVSQRHADHFEGNGESHFNVNVKSNELTLKKPLERHRVLNNAVAHLLNSEKVHAISFKVNN